MLHKRGNIRTVTAYLSDISKKTMGKKRKKIENRERNFEGGDWGTRRKQYNETSDDFSSLLPYNCKLSTL